MAWMMSQAVGDRRLRQPIADRGPGAPAIDETGRPQHGQVLARVGERHADRGRQLAHGTLTAPERVQEHEPLCVGQDLAELGVEAVPLQGVVAEIHGVWTSSCERCRYPGTSTLQLIAFLRKQLSNVA